MGKKVKKKARSGHKEKRVAAGSPTATPQQSTQNTEAPEDVNVVAKERKACPHIDKAVNLEKVSAKLGSSESITCEECMGGAGDKRPGKGKNKHGKKKAGVDKAIWVCLDCGHFSCGGVGLPTTPQSHAVRHAKKLHHALAVQFENPQLRWCFSCSALIPGDKVDDGGEHKKVIQDIVKLIKGTQPEGTNLDAEDAVSGSGSGSVTSGVISKHSASDGLNGKGGYSVRGFINLGNTCFFNSVMQNLIAINKLRDYFLRLDGSIGPLTASMKKLFTETNPEAGLRGVVNPKSLFGSICSKAPQFRGYQQQDSHELLRCLLDGLSTEELTASRKIHASKEGDKSPSADPTFVDAIFGGQLSSTVSCLECGHSSVVYEPFLDVSLPVPTKKPPSKKSQTVSRAKKPKPPPKRSGRISAKASKSIMSPPAQSVPDNGRTSCGSSHLSTPVPEPAVVPLGDAPMDSLDASTVADNMGLISHVPSATQESENNRIDGAETLTSTDSFTWLDYLEPDYEDLTLQSDNISTSKCCGNENSVQQDVSLQKNLEPNLETSSSDNLASLSNQGQDKVLHNHDIASKFNEIALFGDSGAGDATQTHNNTESCNQISFAESNMGINSSTPCLEDEAPLQVQDSEILLLPYTEETSISCEVSSVAGCKEDAVDFDGFGGLFDEPEETASCSVKPLPNSGASDTKELGKAGFVAGNSSDSDPDEVDNSDAPVSVESCLAYFTKPEQLTKTEHAWQCENCSKILQEQKMKERKGLLKHRREILVNGYGDINSSDTPPELAVANRNMEGNVLDSIDHSSLSQNGESNGHVNIVHKVNQKAEADAVSSQSEDACSDKNNDTCSEDPRDGCHNTKTMEGTDLSSGKSKSDEIEDEEMDSEIVKVKRDATKRILINKAPPILTIHLKRFSQDARGRLSKLSGHVDFKYTIDLKPYIDPSRLEKEAYKYRLLGVVEHSGTMRGGHYVAYLRGKKNTSQTENGDFVWYYASDAYVREVSLEEVLRSEAYILFYEEV
ncbi:PREDICTED: ubiquitin carboxyl-terminal hydrolase 2-like [Ipomoea nil]|uniref:ubiquitin carboxyl-terminal hydrolase 2-like n=1 Tax=Ipomoea nil TaxID=35883 RepID=UPI0009010D4E|nr:PREDICTED: ubiquitin carboxyl-terminal hydrolase 2-like [Ipomoea nil]